MDYDGNDISCHNLQLADEGRTKSSPLLRPFDFPKFDFGETLQGNLRFDSLVESEVFLGIESQQGSQWIEDFSQDTNGMEFNSAPADSCPISRKNNVWSEATSSESVEMLLKSVGQEEMMPEKSIILESNACDDQDTLTEYVEPGIKKDEKSDVYTSISEFTAPEELLNDDPAPKAHLEEQLPETEVPSATHVCGKGGTSTNEGVHSYENSHLRESKTSSKESLHSGTDDCSLLVAENINYNAGSLSTLKASEQVHADFVHGGCSGESQEKYASSTGKEDFKSSEVNIDEAIKDVHNSRSSTCLAIELGGSNNQATVETTLGCVGETIEKEVEKTIERECELKSPERDGKDEPEVSPTSRAVIGRSEGFRDGSYVNIVDGYSAESADFAAEHFASPQQIGNPCVQLASGHGDKVEDLPKDIVESNNITRMPLSSGDDNYVPIESCNPIDETAASKSSDTPVLSVDKQPGNFEVCHNESIVASQEAEVLSPAAAKKDYGQVIEENLGHRQGDFYEVKQDISKIKEKDEEQPTCAGNFISKDVGPHPTYEETGSLDLRDLVTAKDNDHELQHRTVDKVGLENNVTLGAIRTTATLYDDPTTGQGEPAVDRSSHRHPDNDCEEGATWIESDVNFSTEVYSVTKNKNYVTDVASRSPSSDVASKRLQPLEKSDDIYVGDSPSMNVTNITHSHHSQADLSCDTSSLKESVNVDVVSGRNEDVTMMKPEGEKELEQAAEPEKSSCGSPTIISSNETSEMDKYQEEIRASVNEPIFDCAKPKDAMGDDTSFTFKVNALPDTTEGERGKSWLPFNAEKSKLSVVIDEVSPTVKRKVAKTPSIKTPRPSAQGSDGIPKGTSERKGKRASTKGTAKENAKGHKETNVHQGSPLLVKGDKVPGTLLSISSSSPHVQFGMTPPYGHIEQSNAKLSSAVTAPHLKINKSSPSASFRQSFTDLQQVQLRAQIFVYGSLIQGTAPDEACMVSAFGPSGGRSIWEPVWRGAVERVRSQKPNSTTVETPLHTQSGSRDSDTVVKQISHSSKVQGSPVGRYNSKGTIPAITNPTIPSSPLWSISTPRDSFPSSASLKGPNLDYAHTVTPLHSYQTPPIKSFGGQTSWPHACFPRPWLASPQTSTFNTSICFQPLTMAESVKLTPSKSTSGSLTSDIKHVMSSPASPVNETASSLPDVKPVEKHAVDSKPKKKKKVPGSDPHRVSLLSEFQSEPVVVPNPFTNLSSVAAIPAPASCSPDILIKAADSPMVITIDLPKHGYLDTRKTITCSEETMSKVTEAKNQAEDASALAAAAVTHSENLWSQLAKQKESGLTSEAEVKLASSLIAISASVSVAKAAAAAAEVAYSIALHAKLMADEASLSCKSSSIESSSIYVQELGRVTPISILKGDNVANQSDSILVAAKEAAKRRVETVLTASKQVENLDAIVKAAELAATAVSQAGKIVAMGAPLPLSDLIKAGPEGYWKSQHSSELAENTTDKKDQESICNVGEDLFLPAKVSKEGYVERGSSEKAGQEKTTCPRDISNDPLDGRINGIMGPMPTSDRDVKSSEVSEAANCDTGVSQLDTPLKIGPTAQVKHDELADPLPVDSIKEASLVEVFKREDGLNAAWYAAKVLRLEDGKAYVCYSDLLSEEDSANLCEWLPLEREGGNAPIIRAAHPLTTLSFQATKKRRRTALGDYSWTVGDRVDVWIDDCWWEGVVTEKNEKDATTLKVHFPAQGETSTVRAWNLRTSRTWTDGKWAECSSSRGNNSSGQGGDTPQEKRQKLESVAAPADVNDKLATDVDLGSEKSDQSKVLPLSTSDRTFNIGKAAREDKRAPQRPLKSGQQKEGSKVIFGVPKPTGKKRKFMEVSKHFPANKNDKSIETNNSTKFAKYLMPQATASRGWKAPLRNDTKEKQTVESRSRAPNSRIPRRILPQRGNLNPTLTQDNDNSTGDTEDSDENDENEPEKLLEPGSSARREAPEVPLSSLLANTFSSSSKRLSSYKRSDRVNKGKAVPSRGKLNTIVEEKIHDANGKSVTEGTQPRRSNRRIQPTHRLLEGLQSSMIIPKLASVSHDKGPRNQSKNASAKGR